MGNSDPIQATDARDVFLCHAHADKPSYVYPVAKELRRYGVTFWLDEAEIDVGDRIAERIGAGLRSSRFLLVFVTEQLLSRQWPQVELDAAFNREVTSRSVVVLPVLDVPEKRFTDSF